MNHISKAELILSNAAEIERLQCRVHESVKHRDEGEAKRLEWEEACAEFHARYDALAFPGGFSGAYERIATGDSDTIDTALTFLEVRPCFFRSGYMWKDILRKCKRAPMSAEQSKRLALLLARYGEWKHQRNISKKRGQNVLRDLSPLLVRLYGHFSLSHLLDSDFDGLMTVGDLYALLCRKLKIEPSPIPEDTVGSARKPHQPFKHPVGAPEYWAAYRAWREFPWTPEDVWATLIAEIRDLYKLEPTIEIGTSTILRNPNSESRPEL